VSRLQPPADPCPQAAPLLQRHALPSAVTLPPGQFDGRLEYATLVNGRTRILPTLAPHHLLPPRGEPHRHPPRWRAEHRWRRVGAELPGLHRPHRARRPARWDAGDPLANAPPPRSAILGSCNSRTQQTPDGDPPCQCPVALNARRDVAKTGRGCEPSVQLTCRLTGDPAIGTFLYSSAA
jgi:hypothetical protein